jgi:hypothetical protein
VTPLGMPESARETSMLSHKGDVAPSGIHAKVTLPMRPEVPG